MVKNRLLFILLIIILSSAFAINTYAYIDFDYEKEYDEFTSGIPDELKPYLPEEVFSGSEEERAKAVTELTDPKNFLGIIFEMLGFRMKEALRMLASLLALVLVSAVASKMLAGSENISSAFEICRSAVMILTVIGGQAALLKSAGEFINRLLAMVNSMLPIMGVLYALGGNVGTATAGTSSLGIFIAVCENFCGLTLMPITGICLAFSLASAFSENSSLGEISGAVKRAYTYGLGLLASIMALIMGMQNQLTAKADSLGARAAKYALGSFIPVLGNTVGENLRTAAAGIEYIRGATGTLAIIIIMLFLLPTLISLALGRSAVNISASVSGMIGLEKEKKFLSELGNIYGYLIAVCSICSLLFIYALTLFVKCSAALGG